MFGFGCSASPSALFAGSGVFGSFIALSYGSLTAGTASSAARSASPNPANLRAAGAGIPGFYTPTSVGTPLAEGKELKQFNGRDYVLELAIDADVALVKAYQADRWGNLTYRMAQRNFGPPMCMAGRTTIVQVQKFVELGDIEPENVITPSIFVDRVVKVGEPIDELAIIREEFGP